MRLDDLDRKLLNLVQVAFPLSKEPYTELGRQLGVDGNEVIQRIKQLKTDGLIRQISPVLDARKLGYQTTLVAMKVADKYLEQAERLIREHPGVSHGYERDHSFNIWITLAIPPTADMQTEFDKLISPIGAEAAFTLPVLKQFKLDVRFDMESSSHSAPAAQPTHHLSQHIRLSPPERLVINELQQDLPLIITPFDAMAERVGMSVADFLRQCQSLKERGVMRRYAAALNHRQVGFSANAMTCWVAPPDMVEIIGRRLALLPEVSHCYERKTNPLWPYNLFAMIHDHTREGCQEIAHKVSCQTGLTEYVLLFSTKEFKKVRNRYLV